MQENIGMVYETRDEVKQVEERVVVESMSLTRTNVPLKRNDVI